jgi:hypothetical protein
MANPDNQSSPRIRRTEQYIQNASFDETYQVLAVESLVENTAGNALVRQKQTLAPGADYDYIDVQQTDADTETYVFKTGGSGGTTVRTIVVNYTDSTKSDIDNVSWS